MILTIRTACRCTLGVFGNPAVRPPPLPPARLAAALVGGYLPCLERLLRRCGRGFAFGDVLMSTHMLISGAGPTAGCRTSRRGLGIGGDGRGSSSTVNHLSHDLPWLLAYGQPRQSASLLASMAKVVRRGAREEVGGVARAWGRVSFAALGMATPDDPAEELIAEGLASMLSRNLVAAFTLMQEQTGESSFDRSAHPATAVTPTAAGGAGSAGGSAAGGDSGGSGSAAYPAGVARLRLLLSFTLAKVVPSLSTHLIRQCRELPMLTGVRAASRAVAGGAYTDAKAAGLQMGLAKDLQHLLAVLLVAQKTVWRSRDLVGKARGSGAGPGSGGSGGSSMALPVGSTLGQGRDGEVELGALADGLQGLLDGEAGMVELVGAALDCLQLLPASERGQVAATTLELSHCSLFSCALDQVLRGLPAASMAWETASPTFKQLLSAGPEKVRAAVSGARAGGYSAGAKAGETLLQIMTASQPGAVVHPAPEVPLWLLCPGEVGRELGGSCCCNARCTRLEGDSEAGQGQGLLVCGRCRAAWYCCRECQAAAWGAGHKKACKGAEGR